MPSARDFITRALRTLGVIEASEVPSDADLQVGLETLNDWVTDLATQRLSIFTVARSVHPLTSGTGSYTIGPGGDFDQARPLWIDQVSIIPDRGGSPAVELPILVLDTPQYQGVTIKSMETSFPSAIYYDYGFAGAGLARIYVLPIPNTSASDLVLYTPVSMNEFADLTTDYAFPPGYARAIRFNLAIELAGDFSAVPSPAVVQAARDAIVNLKRANARMSDLQMPGSLVGLRGKYNIYADRYR